MTSSVTQISDSKTKHGAFYTNVPVSCLCGNTFTIDTTTSDPISVEACPACHPAYNKGKQVTVVSKGRMDHFNQKLEKMKKMSS